MLSIVIIFNFFSTSLIPTGGELAYFYRHRYGTGKCNVKMLLLKKKKKEEELLTPGVRV